MKPPLDRSGGGRKGVDLLGLEIARPSFHFNPAEGVEAPPVLWGEDCRGVNPAVGIDELVVAPIGRWFGNHGRPAPRMDGRPVVADRPWWLSVDAPALHGFSEMNRDGFAGSIRKLQLQVPERHPAKVDKHRAVVETADVDWALLHQFDWRGMHGCRNEEETECECARHDGVGEWLREMHGGRVWSGRAVNDESAEQMPSGLRVLKRTHRFQVFEVTQLTPK